MFVFRSHCPASAPVRQGREDFWLIVALKERGGWHQLHFAPGIDRDAVMARARHNKRWPRGHVVLR